MIVSTYRCKKCKSEYEYVSTKGMKNAAGKKAYPLKVCCVCKKRWCLKEIKKVIIEGE